MSGVDNMNYMNSINASSGLMTTERGFRRRHRPEHRPDPGADALHPGGVAASRRRAQPRRHGPESPPLARWRSCPSTRRTEPTTTLFLANYAYININDPMTRVPRHRPGAGLRRRPVRDALLGASPTRWRSWASPSPRSSTRSPAQNTVNPAGQIGGEPVPPGQEFTYTVRAQGRLTSAEEFGNIVVRANPDGSHRAHEGRRAGRARARRTTA